MGFTAHQHKKDNIDNLSKLWKTYIEKVIAKAITLKRLAKVSSMMVFILRRNLGNSTLGFLRRKLCRLAETSLTVRICGVSMGKGSQLRYTAMPL